MAGAHVVVGAAVVLPTDDGSERYLYKGAPVGAGFTKAGLDNALALGLIKETEIVPVLPEGEPNETWKVEQIDAYAAAAGIDLSSATKKAEKLELIAQHAA